MIKTHDMLLETFLYLVKCCVVLESIHDSFSITEGEGKLLYKFAKRMELPIIEIGSWKGYSTIWIAKGSKNGNRVKVFAIDTFKGDIHGYVTGEGDTYQEFLKNIKLAGVDDVIVSMQMPSENAERMLDTLKVGLLWIDGDHNDIENDYARWFPHLQVGGYIALHDTVQGYDMKPYKVAIRELYKSGKFADVKRLGCITYARKVDKLSGWDKVKNRYALITRYIYQCFFPYYIKGLVIGGKILRRTSCQLSA